MRKTRKAQPPTPPARHAPHDAQRGPGSTGGTKAVVTLAACCLVAGAIGLVYGRAVHAPFVFDDRSSVLTNPSIQRLWPPVGDADAPGPLNIPKDYCTAGRPLVNYSLALNYAVGRLDPTGYHVVNVLLHVGTALLLFSLVRRSLRLDYFAGRFAHVADPLALAVALLFALHPLQTEAVEYVTQRTELLMGFCYLATLYASLRYWQAASPGARGGWLGVASVACLAGMASKEVMVTAPVVVLLYERTFVSGSFRQALKSSWPLYASLAAGWLLLVALNASGPRSASAGFQVELPAYVWWLTQTKVLLLYLKLVVWPWPLVIHYEIPYLTTLAAAWPYAAPVALLGLATLVLLARRTASGFLLACVFLILSPTLVVPIVTEVAVERRMYLPLAALATLVVAGSYALLQRFARRRAADRRPLLLVMAPALVVALLFAALSARRLTAYQTAITLWQDAMNHVPDSPVIHNNLCSELLTVSRLEEALAMARRGLEIAPDNPWLHNNIGTSLLKLGVRDGFHSGQMEEAISHLSRAAELNADVADGHCNLGFALIEDQRPDEAVQQFSQALAIDRHNTQALCGMGRIFAARGQRAEAREFFARALRLDPESAEVHYNLALLSIEERNPAAARQHLEAAMASDATLPEAHYALAGLLGNDGDWRGAADHFSTAVTLRPNYPTALNNLGVALMHLDETDKAIEYFRQAIQRNPQYGEAKANLAQALDTQQGPPE